MVGWTDGWSAGWWVGFGWSVEVVGQSVVGGRSSVKCSMTMVGQSVGHLVGQSVIRLMVGWSDGWSVGS